MIPADKEVSDLAYLEVAFRQHFNFEQQVNLKLSFQRFDADFDELVDLDDGEDLRHLEKLNVVVTPILVTPPTVRAYSRVFVITLPCPGLLKPLA